MNSSEISLNVQPLNLVGHSYTLNANVLLNQAVLRKIRGDNSSFEKHENVNYNTLTTTVEEIIPKKYMTQ